MINGVSERGQNSVYLAESEAICVQFLFPPTENTVQCFPFQKIRKKICLLLLFPHCCRVGSSRIRYSKKSTASEPALQSMNDHHIRKKNYTIFLKLHQFLVQICLFFMLESHDFTKTCKTKIFSSFRRFKKSDPHVGGKNRIRIRSKRSEFASTACRNTIERHFNIEEIIFVFCFPQFLRV